MKNYDELTSDLLKRRDCYVAVQKAKRKAATASLCCICFVALLGVGLWKSGTFRLTIGDPILSSTPTINAPTTTPATHDDPIEISWVVNRVDGYVGRARLNYETSMYYSETKNIADMAQYFGRDFSALTHVMPEGFQFTGNYERKFYYENDGTLVCDDCHFYYKKDQQEIVIHASKIGKPYDFFYMPDDLTPSNINGKEVVIGEFYAKNTAEEFHLVFADFSHNGISYRVTVKNVPFDGSKDAPLWLIDILTALIK